jgi:hypothetical protein
VVSKDPLLIALDDEAEIASLVAAIGSRAGFTALPLTSQAALREAWTNARLRLQSSMVSARD